MSPLAVPRSNSRRTKPGAGSVPQPATMMSAICLLQFARVGPARGRGGGKRKNTQARLSRCSGEARRDHRTRKYRKEAAASHTAQVPVRVRMRGPVRPSSPAKHRPCIMTRDGGNATQPHLRPGKNLGRDLFAGVDTKQWVCTHVHSSRVPSAVAMSAKTTWIKLNP